MNEERTSGEFSNRKKKWLSSDTFTLPHILLVIYHQGKMYHIAVEDWGILLTEMAETSIW